MKEITINGKALPIHFGIKAITEYSKISGVDFHDAVSSTESLSNIEAVVDLALSGFNEGARRAKSDRRYTKDDIWDLFDDDPTLILTVTEIFVEAVIPLTDKLGVIAKNSTPTATQNPSA